MTKIFQQRMTADMEGEFVVFIIGMRVNKFWKVHKWLPVAQAMNKMLQELYANPELGLLSHESWFGRTTIMVQYWQSFAQLEAYSKNKTAAHLPAWAAFNKHVGSNGDVGIWHETYLSQKGKYESIYHNMPQFGLGKVGAHIPITHQTTSARDRVGNHSDKQK